MNNKGADLRASLRLCNRKPPMTGFDGILMGKNELVALLSLSSLCLAIVVWLLLALPLVCLQFVVVVFPDHTHYFSYNEARLL